MTIFATEYVDYFASAMESADDTAHAFLAGRPELGLIEDADEQPGGIWLYMLSSGKDLFVFPDGSTKLVDTSDE